MEQTVQKLNDEMLKRERALGVLDCVGEDEVTAEARRLQALPQSVLRKMSALECGMAAFCMEQFSMRLQCEFNRYDAQATMADEAIKNILADKVHDYRGASAEERLRHAIKENNTAFKWWQVKVNAMLRAKRLVYLANKAEKMGMVLMSIQNTKRGKDD